MNEEEIIRLHSYLVVQSMRLTPVRIVEALQEAYHQFKTAVMALPNIAYPTRPDEHIWSAFEIVEHVFLFMSSYKIAICKVLEYGQRPADVGGRQEIIPHGDKAGTQSELLLALEEILNYLAASVLQANPLVHLDITWKHFELGDMHWREWLLFARIHLLDHIRQVNQMRVAVE
ncbi:MAG TPA: hypothetical protein VFV38_08000 [Ktedonobacteraceae bacterium]|nr:hypothetical protein [Ktedonobacteraceae bacterium]